MTYPPPVVHMPMGGVKIKGKAFTSEASRTHAGMGRVFLFGGVWMLNTIINGDCLQVMKDIPNKSIDMILCDLPYGTTENAWDSIIPLDALWTQYKRIIKENGAIVLTAQTPFDKVLGVSNLEWLRYEWIWEKENGTGHLNANKMPMKNHENILVFYKSLPTYNPQFDKGTPYMCKQGSGSDNWNYNKEQGGHVTVNDGVRFPKSIIKAIRDAEKFHPTQKPVSLFQYLIKTYTNKGETVLDNCMGSGTTALAALTTDRNFIGIEREQKYIDIANKRIQDTQGLFQFVS